MGSGRHGVAFADRGAVPAGFAKHMKHGQKLVRAGKLSEAIGSFEAALAIRPDDPGALFALGNVARDLGLLDVAVKMFAMVLQVTPDSVEAANNLGNVHRARGDYDAAIDVFRLAIAATPDKPALWSNLASTVMSKGDFDNARTFYEEALRLQPHHGETLGNLAELFSNMGRYEEAEPFFRRALKKLPKSAQLRLNYSRTLMAMGRLGEAWEYYEYRLKPDLPKAVDYRHKLRRWRGDKPAERTILVSGEQGIGDQLLFASCLGDLIDQAAGVAVEIEPRLVSLFQRSFPEATIHPYVVDVADGRPRFSYDWLKGAALPDAAIPIGSLPGLYRADASAFPETPMPYLVPDPVERETWRRRLGGLGPGPKVGICWRSGNVTAQRQWGYTDLDDWREIFDVSDVTFVSLQYDESAEELAAARARFGVEIHAFDDIDLKHELDRSAALTAELDLVLSAPTAVAAMAGALAVPAVMMGWGWFTLGTEGWPLQPSIRPVWDDFRSPSIPKTAEALRQFVAAGHL